MSGVEFISKKLRYTSRTDLDNQLARLDALVVLKITPLSPVPGDEDGMWVEVYYERYV